MSVNKKRVIARSAEKMAEESHINFMGGPSYDVKNPILRLRCVAASSFFGEPSYYKDGADKQPSYIRRTREPNPKFMEHVRNVLDAIDEYEWRGLSTKAVMEKCIDEALSYDPKATLELAIELRNMDNIRTTPQIIVVRAANDKKLKGSGLIREYNKRILLRADEPAVQMAYQLSEYGKPIPNSLKKSWADFLKSAKSYNLAKYRMESRNVKTVDVGNMAFGKGFYGYNAPVGELMRGELKLGDDNKTWESIKSNGGSWEDAIKVMGHMALLRNLRNFVNNGVDPKLYLDKLVATTDKGRQLPFRYWTAHRELIKTPGVTGLILDAIEECLMLSIANVPKIPGRNLILVDNSGSARSARLSSMSSVVVYEVGNMMGILTGMLSDEGVVGVFGDRLDVFNVRKRASIMDQLKRVNDIGSGVGAATENGIWLALDKAIKDKEHWDNIFIYSDMQAGHGGLYGIKVDAEYAINKTMGMHQYIDIPKMIQTYRNKVNKNVFVFCVQIAGYEDTLLPEYYDKTYIIGGWSDRILHFADKMRNLFNK